VTRQKRGEKTELAPTFVSNEQNNDSAKEWIKNESNGANNNLASPILSNDIKSPSSEASNSTTMTSPSSGQKTMRRRIRRKNNNSPDDQAECLTEMSVRGLNLFRYASIQDGVYQCTECLKENVQKTFKNKYSFQRHAFLYHEGSQRKGKCLKSYIYYKKNEKLTI
jgi:Cys2His2 zinc finger developmental/cell cycle regulator